MKLILVSSSLKKKYLLEHAGFNVLMKESKIRETMKNSSHIKETISRIAWKKAHSIANIYCQKFQKIYSPILSTNSIIIFNNRIITKPRTREHVKILLRKLSGKTHKIITAFTIIWLKYIINRIVVTNILLRKLNIQMLNYYMMHQMWCKKYKEYNIYENPAILIKTINGDYTNTLGIPIKNIINILFYIKYLKNK